jgi:hypothetical protein
VVLAGAVVVLAGAVTSTATVQGGAFPPWQLRRCRVPSHNLIPLYC